MGDKLVRFKKQTAEDMELDELLRSLSRTQREIEMCIRDSSPAARGAAGAVL